MITRQRLNSAKTAVRSKRGGAGIAKRNGVANGDDNAPTNWRQLMVEHDDLKATHDRTTGEIAYRRLRLLQAIYNHQEFASHGEEYDRVKLLNDKCRDLVGIHAIPEPFRFFLRMLEWKPKQFHWTGGYTNMLAEFVEYDLERQRLQRQNKPAKIINRITQDEHRQVVHQRDHERSLRRHVETQNAELQEQLQHERQSTSLLNGEAEKAPDKYAPLVEKVARIDRARRDLAIPLRQFLSQPIDHERLQAVEQLALDAASALEQLVAAVTT